MAGKEPIKSWITALSDRRASVVVDVIELQPSAELPWSKATRPLIHRADGRTANGQRDWQLVRYGVARRRDNQRAFARARVSGTGVDRVGLNVRIGDVARGEREDMCRQGSPVLNVNQHAAGGGDQVCVGVSDEHARI